MTTTILGECPCLSSPLAEGTVTTTLGMDDRFAKISLAVCARCGRLWLRYHYELESVTHSGRWYLGAITPEQRDALTVENAREMIERLDWYFYGGSYFDGRVGRTSGPVQ